MSHAIEGDEDIITVQAAENMDRATFCKHMSARHGENLGGLPGLDPNPLFTSDYVEDCWRAFHKQLHALGLAEHLDHDHGPVRPKGVSWG